MEAGRTLCMCGCGKIPPIAPETRPQRGWRKGARMPFYPHHSKNKWPVCNGVTKTCRKCRAVKAVAEFWTNNRTADRLQAVCKDCSKTAVYSYRTTADGMVVVAASRLKHVLSKYRITQADYDRMLLDQDGVCKICRKPERASVNGKLKRLAVDHCHSTGNVRGLLCTNCNSAIGKFNDDPDLLRAAIAYLKGG